MCLYFKLILKYNAEIWILTEAKAKTRQWLWSPWEVMKKITSDRIINKLYKEEILSQKYINIVRKESYESWIMKETTTIIRTCKNCKYNEVTENGVRI
jgi:hypothetical protein